LNARRRPNGDAFRAKVIAERDSLATEFEEAYPRLSGALADLLARVAANNARVKAANRPGEPWIEIVETVSRGIKPKGLHFLLNAVRLPPFSLQAHAMGEVLWPRPVLHSVSLPAHVTELSAARGKEMRRIGDEVAARQREGANSPRRRVG
jgi:hypothetical protein